MSVLEKDVFFFTTFGGEALSLAAAKTTINELKEKNVPDYLSKQGKKLKEGYNKIANELNMPYTKCIGYECRSLITFDAYCGKSIRNEITRSTGNDKTWNSLGWFSQYEFLSH